jgi:hypothetical protein
MESFTGYTKTIDADQARALFQARHGYQALEVLDGGPIWLAGPIQEHAAHVGDNGGGLMRRAAEAQRPMTATEARQLALHFCEGV